MRYHCLVFCLLVLGPAPLLADPIYPLDQYPELHEQMLRHQRQFFHINALPFGLSLDAHAKDEAARELINQYLAQGAEEDFQEATGVHPYELLSTYGEYGDLGFFGGIAVAATATRYRTLRRDGAPEEILAEARQRVLQAAESWHLFYVLSGGKGVVARGIRRMQSDPGEPPMPVTVPEVVPLFDEDGQPLPKPKNNGTYREDNSGGALPEGEWLWKDSASKDQLVGQVFAMVAMYDALKDDPAVDQSVLETMQADALGVAQVLMAKREIATLEGPVGMGEYDLILMDADGRPTYHHDLNPLSLEKLYLQPEQGQYNLFNLVMAMGVMKGLYHVTGDPGLEEYLYVELLHNRDFLGKLWNALDPTKGVMDYIYAGTNTNFDNPDMTGVALWLNIYLENDPEVLEALLWFLEEGWWQREGENHTAAKCKQPLWHAFYMGLTDQGISSELVAESLDLLLGFDLGPYWNDARINCDADELAAGECLAVDGKTVLTLTKVEGNQAMASEALHPSIRPPSNFDARSNPFSVNGGGGLRLNPGGDLLCAYWFGRYFPANGPGERNVSPFARAHMPVGGAVEPVEEPTPEPLLEIVTEPDTAAPADVPAAADLVAAEPSAGKGSGGCSTGSEGASTSLVSLLLLLCWLLFQGVRARMTGGRRP